MIARINNIDPGSNRTLSQHVSKPQATKIRRIALFASRKIREPARHRPIVTLTVQFAETTFHPAIRITPNP